VILNRWETGPEIRWAHTLADYLRSQTAALSLAAGSSDEQHLARDGMALLDAAALAEHLPAGGRRLLTLSLAERFRDPYPTGPAGSSRPRMCGTAPPTNLRSFNGR
jgi:hypothetical protein